MLMVIMLKVLMIKMWGDYHGGEDRDDDGDSDVHASVICVTDYLIGRCQCVFV